MCVYISRDIMVCKQDKREVLDYLLQSVHDFLSVFWSLAEVIKKKKSWTCVYLMGATVQEFQQCQLFYSSCYCRDGNSVNVLKSHFMQKSVHFIASRHAAQLN